MISVGRRDAREGGGVTSGSGEGGGGRGEMEEETELEEGEACSYNNNEDDGYSSGIDPDIDLSYIDEKLQNVLGHLQKDFEGGVSAENLGAKFGGYGSFLPVCLRSPVQPHPRTPPKAQHHIASRSPNNLHLEGGHRSSVFATNGAHLGSSVFATNGAHSGRPETTSTGATWLPESKTPSSFFESAKPEGCFRPAVLSEDPGSRCESINIKSSVPADQKLLKVRIKVGSDNLSANKNAAIYSGLGLDASPSVDDSPSESEGMSNDPHDALESPAHIIQIMTALPVQGGLLLSPLADNLIQLIKREKCLKDGWFFPVSRAEPETSKPVSELVRDDRKKLGGKNSKSVESKGIAVAMKDDNKVRGVARDTENEDANVDLACEELVSNTLKLPLLSNTHTASASGDLGKRTWTSPVSKGSKGVARDKAPSNRKKEEPTLDPGDSAVQKCESTLGGKVLGDKGVNPGVDATAGSEEGGQLVEKTRSISVKTDKVAHKKRKAQRVDESDNAKQRADRKVPASGPEGTKLHSRKHNSDGKKKKVSEKHRNLVADLPTEIQSLDDGSLFEPKNQKRNSADDQASKGELTDLTLRKNNGKIRDHYKEFFGDIDDDENQTSLPEMSGDGRLKSFEVEGKTDRTTNAAKERVSTKEIDKLSKFETYGKAGSQFASHLAAAPVSDVAPTTTAEDNWVCCDKCQQWRLLPLGKNPDDLPEKWLCSMLNWLPGMNRCSFTEGETTNALIALYHVPAPESQSGIQNNLGAFVSRGNLEEFRQRNHNRENVLHGMHMGGKKKQGSKDGLPRVSNSMKNGMQVSSGIGSLNEVSQIPLASEPDVRSSKSGRSSTEKVKSKQKEKDKSQQSFSDKDDIKQSKVKVRRDPDQVSATTSKKIRTDGLLEDWTLNHEGSFEKVGPSSSNDLLHTSSLKNIPDRNDHILSKDSKVDIKDDAQVSHKIPRDEHQKSLNDLSTNKRKTDGRDVLKKRKTKERYNPGSLPKAGNDIEDNGILEKEDFSENGYRREKKARVSGGDRMEMGAGKGNDIAEKSSHRKNQLVREELCITSQQGMDVGNCFIRDPGSVEPSLPATSSSSKVSGSHNNKANCFDTKGSPVESVSSSPLRVLKPEKLASETPNITEKDYAIDAGLIPPGAMKRCSDGEDERKNDRSGTTRKDKSGDVACQGSLGSSVDYQEKASSPLSGGKANVEPIRSPNTANNHSTSNGEVKLYHGKVKTLDRCHDEGRQNERPHHSNRSSLTLPGKGSSSRSKDMNRNSSSDFDERKEKVPDSAGEQVPEYGVKQTEGRDKAVEPNGVRYEYGDKNGAVQNFRTENMKREGQTEFTDNNGSHFSIDVNGSREPTFTPRLSSAPDCRAVSERDTLSLGAEDEKLDSMGAVSLSQNKNGLDVLTVNAPGNVNLSREKREVKKVEHSNGIQDDSSRSVMSNGHRSRDHDAPSPARRDSSNQAATNAVKEAKKLKHKADRLKNSGMIVESTRLYFEAALKFLHGACLLENCSNESAKNGEMVQSMQMYSSTAKLCEFCAHEYEKSKDLAAAALAYKCMEVAYMRVIYSSNSNASRDRRELQTALPVAPPGESPASSASDIDNLNHSTADRALLSKTTSSPQVAGSHVIAAKHRPNFSRLLNFAQNINFAMEASRKSQGAFASANAKTGEARTRDGILCVKTALDFNFHDVEGLLHLVRVAFDSISN